MINNMKHIKLFEDFDDDTFAGLVLKYKKGDYVKYNANRSYVFKIADVDIHDFHSPYMIKIIHDDPDALIVGNRYWVNKDELYTNEETERYNNQHKYNL